LVIDSQARGVAAIGFGVGLVFRSIPRALLEEARARDFPVLEVPFEVPFRDIIAFINRSHLSDDFYSLKRTVALQNTLLGALGDTHPEQALVDRLANITSEGVAVFRTGGHVVAEAGRVPVRAIWEEISRRGGPPEPFAVPALGAFVSPILVEGGVRFWLALAGDSVEGTSGLTRPLVEVAERLLRLFELARDVGVMEERVRRQELLNELFDERRAREVSPERLEVFGFSGKGPWRVALFSVGAVPAEAVRLVGNLASASGAPHLIGQHLEHVALVIEGESDLLDTWTAGLAEAGFPVLAAVGRPVLAPVDLVASRGDALLALDFLQRIGAPPGRVLRFGDLELIDALLAAADPGQLRARSNRILEPLREHPQLYETMVAYLEEDLNVNVAARRLHVHPNSLRYRLTRVEEILDRSMRDLATIVDLYVALRAETRFGA
jgi:purine catabolism regulator